MENVFTNVEEFRQGKGNRKSRVGQRISVGDRSTGARQKLTPNLIAIRKLFKLLTRSSISKSDRFEYIGLMRGADQLRFMNMAVLAEVLTFMNNVGNNVTEENLTYNNLLRYIDSLIPNMSSISATELEIIRLRMAATFLRYIRYVLIIKATNIISPETLRMQGDIGEDFYEDF